MLDRDETFPFANLWLARALMLSGRPEEAIPILETAPSAWGYLGYALAVTGRMADARALAAAHPEDYCGLMLVYSGLRDTPRALGALEHLAQTNPWRAATWLHRPEMAVLRGEPRFEAVKARLNLAD